MTSIPETLRRAPSHAEIAGAIPDFALGLVFALAWVAPGRLEPWVVKWLLLTMLLEFVIIHSTAVLGSAVFTNHDPRKRLAIVVPLVLFYCVFALGFSLGFHTWWPLVSFLLLTANRMTPLITRPALANDERIMLGASWAGTTVCYLAGVFVTTLAPIPRLGLTPGEVAALHLEGGGLWIDQPWRVIAFGAFYFTAVGVLELQGFAPFRAGVRGLHGTPRVPSSR